MAAGSPLSAGTGTGDGHPAVAKAVLRLWVHAERAVAELRQLGQEGASLLTSLVNVARQLGVAASPDTSLGVLAPLPRLRERLLHKLSEQLATILLAVNAVWSRMQTSVDALGQLAVDAFAIMEGAIGLDAVQLARPHGAACPPVVDLVQWLEDLHWEAVHWMARCQQAVPPAVGVDTPLAAVSAAAGNLAAARASWPEARIALMFSRVKGVPPPAAVS